MASLIASGTDIFKKMEDLEAEMEGTDLETLIDLAQLTTKKLHKTKFQAGLGKADLIKQKKNKCQEVKDLAIPTITGAINFKKWFSAVNTKNKHLSSAAAEKKLRSRPKVNN